jgi:hypothetical protein
VLAEVPVPGPVTVAVHVHAGTLVVEARPGAGSVQVEARPRLAGQAEQARVAEGVTLRAVTDPEPGAAAVRVDVPTVRGRRQPPVDVRVVVPGGSVLQVESDSAQVVTRGTLAAVEALSALADVHVDQVAGDAAIRTTTGAVTVHRVAGELTLRAGTGVVVVRHADGPVRVASSSGDVDIWYAASDVQAASQSGRVRIGVPRHVDVELDGSTVSGRLDPAPAPVGGPAQALVVQATTVSGDITVRRADPPHA